MKLIITGIGNEHLYDLLKNYGPDLIRATISGFTKTTDDHMENLARLDLFERLLALEDMFIAIMEEKCTLTLRVTCLSRDLVEILEDMQVCTGGSKGIAITTKLDDLLRKYFDTS